MNLSIDRVLVYVLRSGVMGRVTLGRVELEQGAGLQVYDTFGALNEYISGDRLRSWSVLDGGIPLPGWSQVMPADVQRLTGKLEGTIGGRMYGI